MPTNNYQKHLSNLRKAYKRGEMTVYLGAGVSVGNGLPRWDQLVLAMYFSAISAQSLGSWRPYPNYLFAIAEWHLRRSSEPLDITARRIRKYFTSPNAFLESLRSTMYAGFTYDGTTRFQPLRRRKLRSANPTLNAVAELCEKSKLGSTGIQAVVTENYDSLLEIALGKYPFQSIWNSLSTKSGKMPIYHVHGYVPVEPNQGSIASEIIFTEEQYYSAAQDAYSWSNLVQLQRMSSSVGLMVGLSLSDRNMRRLLDAVMRTPLRSENYALLQEPQWTQPTGDQLDSIHFRAVDYLEKFRKSGVKKAEGEKAVSGHRPGIKKADVKLPGIKGGIKAAGPAANISGPAWRFQISGILGEVERLDKEQQTFVLEQLGVHPIWYKQHNEIPKILAEIRRP